MLVDTEFTWSLAANTPSASSHGSSGTTQLTESPPFDFVTFLSQRRGVELEAASGLLESWLNRHQPGESSKTRMDYLCGRLLRALCPAGGD